MKCQNQTSNLFQFKIKMSLFMRVLFYLFFVCISAYANVYFKTTIIKQNIKIMLPVRGPLRECGSIRSGAIGLPYYCTPLVCISAVNRLLAVWLHNKLKTKKPWRFTNSSLSLPHEPSLSVYLLYESVSMYKQPCPYAYPPFPSASSFLKFLRIYM